MQPFIVQWHVAVGTAGCDTAPVSRACSGRKREVVAVKRGGFTMGVLALSNPARPGNTGPRAQETSASGDHSRVRPKGLSANKSVGKQKKLHVSSITPASEEERSPISLSYLTLESTIQQY